MLTKPSLPSLPSHCLEGASEQKGAGASLHNPWLSGFSKVVPVVRQSRDPLLCCVRQSRDSNLQFCQVQVEAVHLETWWMELNIATDANVTSYHPFHSLTILTCITYLYLLHLLRCHKYPQLLVTPVNSSIGIFTHQRHISKVSERGVTQWLTHITSRASCGAKQFVVKKETP